MCPESWTGNNQHVIGRIDQRKNEHPHVVQQPQILIEQIAGDQAGVEIHGNHQQEGEEAAALEPLLAEGIGGAGAGDHPQEGENHDHHDAVQEGMHQGAVLENRGGGVVIGADGPENDGPLHDGRVG